MELSVLVGRVEGNGYRAWSGDPVPASADGTTREEALANLRRMIEVQVGAEVEVVRMRIGWPTAKPLFPDNELTWELWAEVAAIRAAADSAPEPWADVQPFAYVSDESSGSQASLRE